MKIKPAHYAYMKAALASFTSEQVQTLRQAIVTEGKAKDIAMRLRWDLSYRANLSQWLCANVYPYANDDHIDTALRNIMRELFGI